MVELAGQDHARRAGRVRVRRADQHRLGRDAAFLLDPLPHLVDQRPANHQRVDAHQRHPALAVVEHSRADLARVVRRLA